MIALKHLVYYTDQLSLAIKSGMPINKILKSLEQMAPTRRLKHISKAIKDEIDAGASLAGAYKKHGGDLPDMFVASIEVAEQTGHLEDITAEIADLYRQRYEMVSAMKWQLLSLGICIFLAICVLAVIQYVATDTPAIEIVSSILQFVGIFVLFVILIPRALYKNVRAVRVFVQPMLHSIPLFGGVMIKFSLSRFALGMALGIKTGMDVRQTIRIAASAMANTHMEREALKAIEYINNGDSLHESLRKTQVFPEKVNQLYLAGEVSGRLPQIMQKVAALLREEAETTLRAMCKMCAIVLYLLLIFYILGGFRIFW